MALPYSSVGPLDHRRLLTANRPHGVEDTRCRCVFRVRAKNRLFLLDRYDTSYISFREPYKFRIRAKTVFRNLNAHLPVQHLLRQVRTKKRFLRWFF